MTSSDNMTSSGNMTSSDIIIFVLRLIFSMAFAVTNGMDLSFNVYAVPLKEALNFTQTQVEIVASMSFIGMGLGFTEIFITGTCGYITTFVVTWICFPSACGLFALVLAHPDVFHQWPVVVNIIHLILTASNSIGAIALTTLCLEIVPKRFTGTLMATFGTAACFGKILNAGLLDIFFTDNLAGFFLCLSAIFAVVLGLSYAMFYPVALQLERKRREKSDSEENSGKEETSLRDMLRSPFFHVTFWSSTVFSAISYTLLNNITSVTDSLGSDDAFTVVTIMSVSIMTTRLSYGMIFDKFSSEVCGFLLQFTGYISITIGLCLGMYIINSRTVYIIAVLFGFGLGAAIYVPLAIIVAHFGRPCYNFVAGAFFAICAGIMPLFQITTGFLYDRRIAQLSLADSFCYGSDCFFWSFSFLLSVTVVIMCVQGIHFLTTVLKKPKY